ncbi:bacteriocin-like protein [Clostridium sp. AL.422]
MKNFKKLSRAEFQQQLSIIHYAL